MRESKITPAGKATLNYGGTDHEFPVYAGSQGPNVVDIRKLYDQQAAALDIFQPEFYVNRFFIPNGIDAAVHHEGLPKSIKSPRL